MNDFGGNSYPFEPNPTQDERNLAVIAHVSTLLSPLVPLVIYLIKKNDCPFVAKSALQAFAFSMLNVVLALFLVCAGFLLACATMGLGMFLMIPLGMLLGIAHIAYMILAMVKASDGLMYEYPISGMLVR